VESTATALPYSSAVTSSPLFIVGMVLLAAIIIIVLIVALYIRHQNRCEKNTTPLAPPLAAAKTGSNRLGQVILYHLSSHIVIGERNSQTISFI
jgi:hypothetical protein